MYVSNVIFGSGMVNLIISFPFDLAGSVLWLGSIE